MNSIEHLGDFVGAGRSNARVEAFLMGQLAPADMELAAGLYEKRWFDYRFVPLGTSLSYFIHQYHLAYREIVRRFRGKRRMYQAGPLVDLPKAHVTGFWRAMCYADEFGLPYDFFILAVMEWADRRGWHHIPLPANLYDDRAVIEVTEKWSQRLQDRFITATAPEYDLVNYVGHPAQDAYHGYLIQQVRARHVPRFALATVLFERPQLPMQLALDSFGAEMVREAKRTAA
jgi:hypothetical protein